MHAHTPTRTATLHCYLPCNKMCTYGALCFYSFINELIICTIYHTWVNFGEGKFLAKGIYSLTSFFLANIYKYSEM